MILTVSTLVPLFSSLFKEKRRGEFFGVIFIYKSLFLFIYKKKNGARAARAVFALKRKKREKKRILRPADRSSEVSPPPPGNCMRGGGETPFPTPHPTHVWGGGGGGWKRPRNRGNLILI